MPKTIHFNSKKPEKSISVLTNYVLKKYLDIDTDVTEYVKPAIEYAKVCIYIEVERRYKVFFI